jgi:very-short-patch-repair endonuclease
MKERLQNITQYKIIRRNLRNDPTMAERVMWKYIRNSQLGYKFRRQQSIGQYIVDFYCPDLNMIIELDGWVHGDDAQKEKDIIRQKFLEQNGFVLLRYRNEEMKYDKEAVIQDVKNKCDALSTTPNPSFPRRGEKYV